MEQKVRTTTKTIGGGLLTWEIEAEGKTAEEVTKMIEDANKRIIEIFVRKNTQ